MRGESGQEVAQAREPAGDGNRHAEPQVVFGQSDQGTQVARNVLAVAGRSSASSLSSPSESQNSDPTPHARTPPGQNLAGPLSTISEPEKPRSVALSCSFRLVHPTTSR